MVYCKLKKAYKDKAVYFIGRYIGDMTGEVVYYSYDRGAELLKQAEEIPVLTRHISRIYAKYKSDFEKGIFKEKLSVEIG